VWGVGPVFASALNDAGITTYAQLAKADLASLRAAIAAGSDASDASANEETWAEQAAFLAAGDQAGLDAFVERLKSGDEPATGAPATPETGNPSGSAKTGMPEEEVAEPTADEASTQPDDAPVTPSDDETLHPDTPQGAAPGTGEPPPETGEGDKGTAGGSQHRG
jgi:hypothetical protein